MKREKMITSLMAITLATGLSFGAVGCMVTAFALDVSSMELLFAVCLALSVAGALCFRTRWSGVALLVVLALVAGALWREGQAVAQTRGLLERISRRWDQVYHWGYLEMNGSAGDFWPVAALAALIALITGWAVAAGEPAWLPLTVGVLPVLICVVAQDTVPSEPFLYLLLLTLVVLVLTSFVRQRSLEQGNYLTFLVALPAMLAMIVLFLLNPKDSYVNHGADLQQRLLLYLQQLPQRVTQLPQLYREITQSGSLELPEDWTDDIDLRDVGPEEQKKLPVMQVTATAGGVVYLRSQDLDFYTGTGWRTTQRQEELFPGNVELAPVGEVTVRTNRIRDVMYLPYYTLSARSLISGRIYNYQGLQSYTVPVGELPEGWQHQSLGAPGVELTPGQVYREEENAQLFLNLPRQTRQEAQEYLDRLHLTGLSRTDQARAIAAMVKTSADYDLATPAMPKSEEDFALWFLDGQDSGYCVHFATATAVLLRAAGIPARYVTGYMVSAPPGQTVTVTAGHAHAWVEYYEPALDAWMILDATPAAEGQAQPAPSEPLATQPVATEPSDGATQPQQSAPAGTEGTAHPPQTRPPSVPAPVEPEPALPEEKRPEPEKQTELSAREEAGPVWWLWLLLALIPVGIWCQRAIRLRVKRPVAQDPNGQLLAMWRQAEALSRHTDGQRPPRPIEQLAQKAKFSQHVTTGEELEQMEAYLLQCRQTLRRRPWYRRLVDRWVYVLY